MADTIKFQCDLSTTNPAASLGFEVLLNDKSVFRREHVTESCQITFDIADDDSAYKLHFVMFGKTADHTKVDDQGNIISDAVLEVCNIQLDDILIDQLLHNKTEYVHDFNGSQNTTIDKFYGIMGCNGTATFEFTTPFYLWLLENM